MNKKDITKYQNIFSKIGLSEDDAKVYACLIGDGELLPTQISKKTNLHRPVVYKAIENLDNKSLIRISSKGKRKTYIAESPEKLEALFKEYEKSFFDDMEDIYKLYESSSDKPTISVAEGEQAIRDTYSDVVNTLDKNEKYYRYSSIKQFKKNKYIPKDYEYIRDKKGLERLVITGYNNQPFKKFLGRSIKTIPKEFDLFQDEINLIIYKDKVAIIDYPSKMTINIQHKKFAEFQKKLFGLLFSRL
jgi:sugar-specific transcriptional regulator TrmB